MQAPRRQHRFVSFVVRGSDDIGTAAPERTVSLRCVVCLEARYKADYALALIDFEQVLLLGPRDPDILHRAALEQAATLAVTSFASR